MARGRLRKLPQLRQALRGRFSDHHALLVGLSLAHLEHLEGAIATLDTEVDQVISFARARDQLDTITGVEAAAETIIAAEIGVDMAVFPTAGHLASWAGAARNNRTGGKRRSPASCQGQPLAGGGADRVRLGRCPQPRHLPVGAVLAAGPTHRQEEGSHGRGSLDPGDRLAPTRQ